MTEIIESQYRVGMAINAIPVWVTSGIPEFGGGSVIELGGSVIVSSYSAAVAKVFFGIPHTCDTCIDTSVTGFINWILDHLGVAHIRVIPFFQHYTNGSSYSCYNNNNSK
jgi:hypothetical protein